LSNDTLLTARQVAEQLQCNVITIRRLCQAGELKASQIGGKGEYRIYQSAVDEYLERNSVVAEQPSQPDKPFPCKGTLNDSNKPFSVLRT